MFLFLSKLLPYFIYPLSLAGMLLLAALLTKREKRRKWLIFAAILLVWLGGNTFVSSAVVRSLEWQYLPPAKMPDADAIVILGGGTLPAQYPRPTVELDGAGDRVLYGARLYREGHAPLVVVTGGLLPWSSAEGSGAAEMRDLLVFMGVPAEAILLETQSANTYENAVFTREILEPQGVRRIILVTSAMHMPRAAAIFEKQGFEVTPAPTDYLVTRAPAAPFRQSWPQWVFALFPTPQNMLELTLAVKEYAGIWVYGWRGWL
jgi:uncharacterized SAM-binding protein YcdF (DUF218 family)